MPGLDDDTLIALIKERDTHAEALLCAKYWDFARKLGKQFAVSYSDVGLTEDDFAAVAFSSIVVAIKKYNTVQHKSFKSYWLKIAKNQCINYIYDNCYVGESFSHPLSLDMISHEDGLSLHETCGKLDYTIKNNINLKQLFEYIRSPVNRFTEDEQIVAYYMFIEGYNFDDVQQVTKWKNSKVYRVAKNARAKVSNFFKSRYFK